VGVKKGQTEDRQLKQIL